MAGHLVKVMAAWVRDRELSEQRQVDSKLWEDMQHVLEEFVNYMEQIEDILDAYATNCEAAGWTRRGREDQGTKYTDHSVGDVMKCRLMVGALHFVTGWSNQLKKDNDPSHNDTAMKAIMRCLVANVFAYILAAIPCGKEWLGPDWAWETMKQFAAGSHDGSNPISAGTCTRDVYTGINIGKGNLQEAVKNWLQQSPQISARINAIQKNQECNIDWDVYKAKMLKHTGDISSSSIFNETAMHTWVKTEIKGLLETVKKSVQKNITRLQSAPRDSMGSGDSDVDSEDDDEDEQKKSKVQKEEPLNGKSPATKTIVPTGGGGQKEEQDTRSDKDKTHAGTTPAVPPTTVPAEPKKAVPEETKPETGVGKKAAEGSHQRGASGSTTPVTGTPRSETPPQGAGQGPGPGQQPPPPPPPPPEPAGAAAPSEPQGATSPAAPNGAAEQTTPVPTESNGKDTACPKDVQEESLGAGRVSISFESKSECKGPDSPPGSSVNTSTDDPPPRNPPKPETTNPNPNQSGSSGSFSDADLADGVSAGEGKPGEHGTTQGSGGGQSSGPSSAGAHTPGSSGPGSTRTSQPGTSGTGSSGGPQGAGSSTSGGQGSMSNDQPLPTLSSPKPFDPRDLIPYTPAIIPAVVGIGIIAFFLWKYFAYLANRRRTYRTVRDVPSPPLDEEILEHLQRGAPPPDYGYTMIRHRQPSSTCARRRRHPRVHKRTIIELHLEVLNECEVTEWENVKHDYLKIVVEQFARDLQQDEETNNNILGVSTSNHGLPGTHVSSTLDAPTDADGTDPSRHDEDDPWSCMENIQLATDPAASNHDDSDPWSCMETIRLAADPCRPNDFDPWSCMETIQLATDTSPPNAHDPDPWSCMETIQLATDPCPPNAEDSDPCKCMQTIQLATDASPPNADALCSCMETIQLATDASPPNEDNPDPWRCMESIALDAQHSGAHSDHVTSYCIRWINWIDRNKDIVRECTEQPWFLQLTSAWKQYLREHMAHGTTT
ncbi:hypothetical protein AK88_05401 [Plasmodium fragile]|uniref:Schizont-infected cell agglutination C-terminal domain-containing protein n=1 Tax=Plasmodium fragile TaxID=5857 RepID=A0A0D9QDP2_PLAFR|nr:uncharacterized protein AK88_05401 [Plasmodium fragile]KJP84962.1 hypothetical protein AK88_05401 [Plasmodium fragile]